MSIFRFENKKVVIDPAALTIPEFSEIYKRDTSEDKYIAFQELSYVYFMAEKTAKNFYANLPEDRKEEYVLKHISIPGWTPDSKVKLAIEVYKELSTTPAMRFLDSARQACESLIQYFSSIDWNERTDKGMPVYKVNEVTSALEKSGKILQSIEVLKEKVEKELAISSSKVRGGGSVGLFED